MNTKGIIKVSNIIGLISIILLAYWVFIFISITVFGLRIFKETLTDTFYLSVIGIIALMFGALMINIMLNLSRISENLDQKSQISTSKKPKLNIILLILSFPVIFILLYIGDYSSSLKKEKQLISSAEYLIKEHPNEMKQLSMYCFDSAYIERTSNTLRFLTKTDEDLQAIAIIVQDTVQSSISLIEINGWTSPTEDNKTELIFSCSKDEKEYLQSVFNEINSKPKFEAANGEYELFYPVTVGNKTFVLYFTKRSRYGGYGS